MADNKRDDKGGAAALFIPAGVIGGMGVGFLINNLPAGMFIGLGLGFAAFAIVSLVVKK